jgi:hypothetical protein
LQRGGIVQLLARRRFASAIALTMLLCLGRAITPLLFEHLAIALLVEAYHKLAAEAAPRGYAALRPQSPPVGPLPLRAPLRASRLVPRLARLPCAGYQMQTRRINYQNNMLYAMNRT